MAGLAKATVYTMLTRDGGNDNTWLLLNSLRTDHDMTWQDVLSRYRQVGLVVLINELMGIES